jgi:FkbM family methyltransferase
MDLSEEKINFSDLVRERLNNFFVLMKEGYQLRDKIIILEYHLKAPIQLLKYLLGIKNSRKLVGKVFLKNRYGLFSCGDNFSSIYGISSICEPIVRKEVILTNGVAMDIGANCGMYTIPLAKMLGSNGRVIAIEAEKNNAKLLRENVSLNNLKNVSVIEKGCFSKKGEMSFYIDNYGTGGHSLLEIENARKEIIQTDTIDNILKDLGIEHVDLIKIDVEGVEIEAFKGAKNILNKSHPRIIFEAMTPEKINEITDFLKEYKYNIRKITEVNYIAE